MMLGELALMAAFLMLGKKPASSSPGSKLPGGESELDELGAPIVRIAAGDVLGETFAVKPWAWRVGKARSDVDAASSGVRTVLAQGSGEDGSTSLRMMLEAFAAATPSQPCTAFYRIPNGLPTGDRVLTISIFPLSQSPAHKAWGWTLTDGAQSVTGFEDNRGPAILAAFDRARRQET